jgi:hypothetical protein
MKRVSAAVVLALLTSPRLVFAQAAQQIQPAFQALEPGSSPEETFRLNAFGLVSHEVSAWPPTLVFGGKWWRITRGKFRNATTYDDFFRTLGRPDLADQYQRRRVLSGALIWGGLAAEVTGVVLFVGGLYKSGFGTPAKVGLGLFAGGFVASAIGATIQHPALSQEEALGMVGDYNQRLRIHLGLSMDGTDLIRRPVTASLQGRW